MFDILILPLIEPSVEINNTFTVGGKVDGFSSSENNPVKNEKPEFTENSSLWGCDIDKLIAYLGYEKHDCGGIAQSCFYLSVAYQAMQMGLKKGEFSQSKWQEYRNDLADGFKELSDNEKLQICGTYDKKLYTGKKYIKKVTKSGGKAVAAEIDGRLAAAKYGRPVIVFDAEQGLVIEVSRDMDGFILTYGELRELFIEKEKNPILIYRNNGHYQALVLKRKNK